LRLSSFFYKRELLKIGYLIFFSRFGMTSLASLRIFLANFAVKKYLTARDTRFIPPKREVSQDLSRQSGSAQRVFETASYAAQMMKGRKIRINN
jgi:hypothetical protein